MSLQEKNLVCQTALGPWKIPPKARLWTLCMQESWEGLKGLTGTGSEDLHPGLFCQSCLALNWLFISLHHVCRLVQMIWKNNRVKIEKCTVKSLVVYQQRLWWFITIWQDQNDRKYRTLYAADTSYNPNSCHSKRPNPKPIKALEKWKSNKNLSEEETFKPRLIEHAPYPDD